MPNKASEYVDWACAHVDSTLELHSAKQHCDDQVSSRSENVMDTWPNEVESETFISPEQEVKR